MFKKWNQLHIFFQYICTIMSRNIEKRTKRARDFPPCSFLHCSRCGNSTEGQECERPVRSSSCLGCGPIPAGLAAPPGCLPMAILFMSGMLPKKNEEGAGPPIPCLRRHDLILLGLHTSASSTRTAITTRPPSTTFRKISAASATMRGTLLFSSHSCFGCYIL